MAEWGQIISGKKQYPLHEGQEEVMLSRARFIAALAGTGGGKSAIGALWLLTEVAKHPQGTYMCLAPTFKILQRATVPTLRATFEGTALQGEYVEGCYRLPTGGTIWCLSTDRPDSIEGGQVRAIWLDEGGQASLRTWENIQNRLGLHQGRALITTTLYREWWLKTHFEDLFLKGDPNYCVVHFPSSANPKYSEDEMERKRTTMSKHRFSMVHLGEFAQPEGIVYPDFNSCVVEPMTVLPYGHLVGGIDWGFAQPFVALAGVLYEDESNPGERYLHIFSERYMSRKTLSEHSKALLHGVTWYADPSEPGSITALRNAGHTVLPASNPIQLGIDAVTKRILTRRITISTKCKAVIAEAQEYCYKENAKGEVPVAAFDHALDALRYLIMGIDKRSIAHAA